MLATSTALKRFESLALSLRFTDKSAKKGLMYQNLKIPNKVRHKSTDLIRHLINSRSETEFPPSLLAYFLLSIEYKTPSLTPDSEKIISGVCRYSIKNMIGESPAMIISARSASGPKISARSLRSIPSHSV